MNDTQQPSVRKTDHPVEDFLLEQVLAQPQAHYTYLLAPLVAVKLPMALLSSFTAFTEAEKIAVRMETDGTSVVAIVFCEENVARVRRWMTENTPKGG